jgi:PAB1-binding protein PBP1
MKPEDSLPCSQQPAIDPYPEPDESGTNFSPFSLTTNPTFSSPVFLVVSSLQVSYQNFVCISDLS